MDILHRGSLMEWLLVVLLALYPCELSESDAPEPSRPSGSPARVISPPAPRPGFPTRGISKVDKEKFLAQFELQAGHELMPCLRQTAGQAGAVAFLGRLHKNGDISGVHVLSARTGAEDCAVRAVEKMKFQEVGAGLSDDNVEVSWRFDY